ncbi:hypothetical protein ANN_14473 [Periplaneta americana]|uniref:Uncharacterized protein n=1 Tax=Periplaneta americana TaxID=6978 RepID=A0ABQ8SXN3_PERAM|nr:hypothetical protein ANN_14473 [Periplaneta americana]
MFGSKSRKHEVACYYRILHFRNILWCFSGMRRNATNVFAAHILYCRLSLQSIRNAEDAVSIATAQECFTKNGIQEKIQYIHNRFYKIPEILKQLEARNNSLEHSLSLIYEISSFRAKMPWSTGADVTRRFVYFYGRHLQWLGHQLLQVSRAEDFDRGYLTTEDVCRRSRRNVCTSKRSVMLLTPERNSSLLIIMKHQLQMFDVCLY